MIFCFIAKHRGIWPVQRQREALGVSRSGFYAWTRRGPSARTREDGRLLLTLRTAFEASDWTYGVRRLWPDAFAAGHRCGRERVARLVRAAGLRARPRRRAGRRPSTGQPFAIAGNMRDRTFVATAPNQKWVADFTYVHTHEGWLFVAVVLDLFSRRVVGWAMQATMTADLVSDALVMAVHRRGPATAVAHHSDQEVQYTSEQFQRLLMSLGITCSMSRRGNVWDNAVMESFFSTMKTERCRYRRYSTRDEAREDIIDYIERFYNPVRRHSTLGNISPVMYERRADS